MSQPFYSKSKGLQLFLIWTAALPIVFFGRGFLTGLVSMPFHETGHFFAAWLELLPAIPTFMLTVQLSNSTEWLMGAIVIPLEIISLLYFYNTNKNNCASILILCLMSQFFFLIRNSDPAEFFTFGGVAGEFILPLLVFLVLLDLKSPLTPAKGILAAVSALSFWGAEVGWITAYLGSGPMPYPLDTREGFIGVLGVFADESTAIGDMQKLVNNHGWTEANIRQSYFTLALVTLACFALIWTWYYALAFRKKSQWPSSSKPDPSRRN